MDKIVIRLIFLSLMFLGFLRVWFSMVKSAKRNMTRREYRITFGYTGRGAVIGAISTFVLTACLVGILNPSDWPIGIVLGLIIGLTAGNGIGMGIGYLLSRKRKSGDT